MMSTEAFYQRTRQSSNSSCIIWTGGFGSGGYGRLNKRIDAHRWILQQKLGATLPSSVYATHACNNPACVKVSPDHVRPGNAKDNSDDQDKAGSIIRGERHPNHKLTERQARFIRDYPFLSAQSIAQLFGVNERHVYRVRNGTRWGHLANK